MWTCRYTNWETDARVPMIVRVPWKSAARGTRTSAIVEHIDLYLLRPILVL
jgi:arylsulfatase A-like enzyme